MSRLRCAWFLPLIFVSLLSFSEALAGQARGVQRPAPKPRPVKPVLPAYMKIRVESGNVTAQIQNTPLPQVLEELAARSGVVFELGTNDETSVSVSFYNVGLQEAVQRLVEGHNSIFFYGRDPAGASRIEFVRILQREAGPQQQVSIQYIGSGSVTKTGEDRIETTEDAFKALAESENIDLRQQAIEILVASKEEPAVQAVTDALDDQAPEVKVAAIEGLAALGARAALPQIILRLKDPHPGVRHSAIVAVSLLGDAVNIKDLLPMGRDKDPNVAAAAETAIKKLSLRQP
jgi:hypothetical protein